MGMGPSRLLTTLRRGGGITWPQYDNLAAMYLFDDGSGTQLTDSGPNGLHGTLGAAAAAPSWVTEGLSFDGGDYVTVPGGGALDLSGNSATLVTVFNSTADTGTILGAYQAAGSFYGYAGTLNGGGTGAGQVNMYTNGGLWDRASTTRVDGDWHCLVAILTSGTWTFYLDGNSFGSPVSGASITEWTGNKTIGVVVNLATNPFTGKIGALGAWSTPLESSDAATVYSNLQTIMAARGVTLPDPT
jgi:hypothetical protein